MEGVIGMQWLRNLPVPRKLFFAFGIVCGLCIVMGTYTFITFHSVGAKCLDVSGNAFPSVVNLDAARSSMNIVRREDLDLMMCQTPDCVARHAKNRQQALEAYRTSIKHYEAMISYPGERELYEKAQAAASKYWDTSDRGIALISAGKSGDALDVLSGDATITLFNNALETINSDIDLNVNEGTASAEVRHERV